MGAVPLVTPEAREAHCGAQFPGLGILLARDGECASAVQGRYHRDKISLSQPANSGLLAENQEIPVSGKMSPTGPTTQSPANRDFPARCE